MCILQIKPVPVIPSVNPVVANGASETATVITQPFTIDTAPILTPVDGGTVPVVPAVVGIKQEEDDTASTTPQVILPSAHTISNIFINQYRWPICQFTLLFSLN